MVNVYFIKRMLWLVVSFFLYEGIVLSQEKQPEFFYQNLQNQIHSDNLSPLLVSNSRSSNCKMWEVNQQGDMLYVVFESKEIQIGFHPFRWSVKTGNINKEQFCSVILGMVNGEKKEITALNTPDITENSIVFKTNISGVTVKLTPCIDYLKWTINTSMRAEIDSMIISLNAKGPFFGGGERFISSKLDGRTISNQPLDHSLLVQTYKENKDVFKSVEPSYLQIPFVLNPNGLGWYFDCAATILMTFKADGDHFRIKTNADDLIFYSFNETGPKKVLEKYTDLVGRQPELPDWAYGVWINLLEGQDSVLSKATRLYQQKMPVTAVWLFDMDDPNTSTGWPYWSKGIYTNYRNLTDSIHALGYKVLTYLRPFGFKDLLYYKFDNPFYLLYDSLDVLLYSKNNPAGRYSSFMSDGQYDFFNPRMGTLWENLISELLLEDNFDGWMEDFGDIGYAYDNKTNTWQAHDFGLNYPLSHDEYANMYPLVYHKLTHVLSEEMKSDVVTFSRSGSAGSAPYTRMVWAGDQHADWDRKLGYPSAITAGISIGLSGYGNWASDILCDSESIELWKRWVQFASFTPLMRDHLWTNKPTAIDIWTSEETFEYFKKYAQIHMDLVPYIQESSRIYRETGTPIIRHMMLEFPNDRKTYACEYQYMFGSNFMIAPVIDEGTSVLEIYFPEGEWRNFWTHDLIISTGEWMKVKAPLDRIPVFERL